MDSNSNSRSKARLIVVSVFVIGFAAGALALNLYQKLSRSSPDPMPRNGTEVLLRRMNDKVGLSADQQDSIKKILDETNDNYGGLRGERDPRIKDLNARYNAVRQESRLELFYSRF